MLFAFLIYVTTAFAIDASLDADYPNHNTEGENALFGLTAGADDTAMNFDAPASDSTGSETPLPSWGWRLTGDLNAAREVHTATLLQNGMVLVAGGNDPDIGLLASAELYDQVTHTWTATGSLNTARWFHTATLLQNGMVLIAGGDIGNLVDTTSAELYDPTSGTWTITGSLNTARALQTATLLQNGMVLVAGGDNEKGALASAELYDPAS